MNTSRYNSVYRAGDCVRLGMMVQTFSTLSAGLIIALIYSWKFALFVFGVMPFLLFGGLMQIRLTKGFAMNNKSELAAAGKVRILQISNSMKT
jgi:hypothetical protein